MYFSSMLSWTLATESLFRGDRDGGRTVPPRPRFLSPLRFMLLFGCLVPFAPHRIANRQFSKRQASVAIAVKIHRVAGKLFRQFIAGQHAILYSGQNISSARQLPSRVLA